MKKVCKEKKIDLALIWFSGYGYSTPVVVTVNPSQTIEELIEKLGLTESFITIHSCMNPNVNFKYGHTVRSYLELFPAVKGNPWYIHSRVHSNDPAFAQNLEEVTKALNTTYRDPYGNVDRLEQKIDEYRKNFNPSTNFSRFFVITQPTMSGKTKALIELAKRRKVVYINMKTNKNPPFSSPLLVEFLLPHETLSVDEYMLKFTAYLIIMNKLAFENQSLSNEDWYQQHVSDEKDKAKSIFW